MRTRRVRARVLTLRIRRLLPPLLAVPLEELVLGEVVVQEMEEEEGGMMDLGLGRRGACVKIVGRWTRRLS